MIYLDNAATTKVDPRVVDAMLPYFTENYGNASSKHKFGGIAHEAVKKAREQVASLIGSKENEIIFTSGATEGINLAIKGIVERYKDKGNHIITVKTEHSAVLDTCKNLETKGAEVTYLNVDSDGIISLEELKSSIKDTTILVSVMLVNNEIGVIQPIEEISSICHEAGIFFMSDATQAVGKMDVDVYKLGIDLMTFSGHKFHGPKGTGAVFIRKKRPFKIKLEPQLHGGGHEKGSRSGTLNVPGIVGVGKACEIAKAELKENYKHLYTLRNALEMRLLKMNGCYLNGHKEKRIPNIVNVRLDGIDSDALIVNLNNIAMSKGSACSNNDTKASHVLSSLGLSEKEVFESIRISFSKYNTESEIRIFGNEISEIISNIKSLS